MCNHGSRPVALASCGRVVQRRSAVAGLASLLGFVALLLAACGGGGSSSPPSNPTTFTIGGTVAGLANGTSIALQNSGGDTLTVLANGKFSFTTPVASGGSYLVTVSTQPVGQTCSIAAGIGSGINANISSVQVVCSADTYSIGGMLSGLAAGMQVTVLDNGADALNLTANGSFTFPAPVAYNGSYVVTVQSQSVGETCSASSGSGSGAGVTANVTSVLFVCSTNSYPVTGSLAGLASGAQVTLLDNGGDPLTLTANGAFQFPTSVASGASYVITVGTQPVGQTCTVTAGSGSGANLAVNVSVSCSSGTFTIGGTVAGLAGGAQLTLLDNGADARTVTANGAFQFLTPVAYNSGYLVTISTFPAAQSCWFLGGSSTGTLVTANVTSVAVQCGNTGWPVRITNVSGNSWGAIAVSSDGLTIVGALDNDFIYRSTDGGVTFAKTAANVISGLTSYVGVWNQIALSADGSHIAVVALNGILALSADGGASWTNDTTVTSAIGVAMSSDATHLLVANGTSLYVSANSGGSWTNPAGTASATNWKHVFVSPDGVRMEACSVGGTCAGSTDSGVTWAPITMQAVGAVLAAVSGDGTVWLATGPAATQLSISRDQGGTWTTAGPTAGITNWTGAAASVNGTHLAALDLGSPGTVAGNVYLSFDGGTTWSTASGPNTTFTGIAVSDDGTHWAGVTITPSVVYTGITR